MPSQNYLQKQKKRSSNSGTSLLVVLKAPFRNSLTGVGLGLLFWTFQYEMFALAKKLLKTLRHRAP